MSLSFESGKSDRPHITLHNGSLLAFLSPRLELLASRDSVFFFLFPAPSTVIVQ